MAQGQTHGGKGSAVRPTDKKKFENNSDAIFGTPLFPQKTSEYVEET